MRIKCNIRLARSGDGSALAQLSDELGYSMTSEQAEERLARLDPSEHAVFVAEASEVIGWIHVLIGHRLESFPFAEIGGLVVTERARSLGVGAALVAAGEDWARESGMSEIRVRSNVIRERAHRFYERIGFETAKRQVVFRRRIRAEQGSHADAG